MFQTEVVGFKKIYLLILSVWLRVIKVRSRLRRFFNGTPYFWFQNL